MDDMTEKNGDVEEPLAAKATANRRRNALIAAAVGIALVAGLGFGALCFGGGTTPDVKGSGEAAQEKVVETATKGGEAIETCDHDWTITYKTVRHDAVTHTESVAPVYATVTTYHTVCNECNQTIDGIADQHIKDTGHSGYSTNVPITGEVLESQGYSYEVTDTPAYDETVPDKMTCTKCGEARDIDETQADTDSTAANEQ